MVPRLLLQHFWVLGQFDFFDVGMLIARQLAKIYRKAATKVEVLSFGCVGNGRIFRRTRGPSTLNFIFIVFLIYIDK